MATVRLFAGAAAALGYDVLTAPAGSVSDVLAHVARAANDDVAARAVIDQCSVLLDGTFVRDQSAIVSDNSTVDLLPPFAGG